VSRRLVIVFVVAAVFAVAVLGSVFTDWYIFDGGINPRYRK